MNLSFTDIGQGPVIVFIHSYLLEKNIWKDQIQLLKDNYRCIAIDLPGHGLSESFNNSEQISLQNIAFEINSLLDCLKIDTFHCVGMSSGSLILPYLYNNNKKKILSLTMINSYLGKEAFFIKNLFLSFGEIAEVNTFLPKTFIEQISPLFFPIITENNKVFYDNFIKRLMQLKGQELDNIITFGKLLFSLELDLLDLIKNINVPICFINGETNLLSPFDKIYSKDVISSNVHFYKTEENGDILTLIGKNNINPYLIEFLNTVI